MSNIKAMRILQFILPLGTFRLVSVCTTAKEIWDRLKELYLSDIDIKDSVQTLLLSDFGAFSQKADERIDQTFNRFNHLLSIMIKNNLRHEVIEQKVTFMNGLRSEWRAIVSTVKAHEQFKSYSLAKLVGILRSHKDEVTKEVKIVFSLGSLALVAKGKKESEDDSESDLSDSEISKEDKALFVSNPKNIYKKIFSRFRNKYIQGGNSSFEKAIDEGLKNSQSDEEKMEKKVLGDSGYDCNYCHGKNHFPKECMLRRMNEKKESEKDDAYYPQKIKVLRKRSTSNAKSMLIVQEGSDEDGRVENREDTQQTTVKTLEAVSQQRLLQSRWQSAIRSSTSQAFVFQHYSTPKYDSLCNKLSSENAHDNENFSEFNESEMSGIFVGDEVDCLEFVQNNIEPNKKLIYENLFEFIRLVESKGSSVLNAKATIFPKVQIVPNQVFVKNGLDKNDT
ncbi:uncharacterized protein LOC111896725 [Lactuca sativa]|uniref:uncharacterized protein LOC111896725 n=1 Tax=Lactuca sativa TaxID=4236 RepID=UPI000CD8BF7C|nr:uncharacterized protein LOC111896725 [Lactuca sativa]